MAEHSYISFNTQDLIAFSEASGDRNPLHLSREYARRTPYGQPVVFGCLGAIACLGRLNLPRGLRATLLEADFFRPMFVGVQYRLETAQLEGRWEARLFDGSTHVLLVAVTGELVDRIQLRRSILGSRQSAAREAVVRPKDDLVVGLRTSGSYSFDADSLSTLQGRWGAFDLFLGATLCWSSYIVGMDLPGESALFFKLSLRLHESDFIEGSAAYDASVAYSGFGQIKLNVSLCSGASTVVSGQCWSYVRQSVPQYKELDSTAMSHSSLAGRSAVLIGSSRGLGAAIKRALELRGAIVFGLARSGESDHSSRTEVGNAADPQSLRLLRERLLKEHGSLDILICNACPPLLPLALEPNASARIGAFINEAVALVIAPLTEFLELLNRSGGCAVIISSVAAEQPVKDWPHYVAAKRAVEALARVAPLQYPKVASLIVRPRKLLTTMTNTPLGHLGATSPGLFADRIAQRLEHPLEPGKTEILE